MVGELVIAQAMLAQVVHGLPEDVSGRLAQVLDEVVHHTRELKDSVMSMRAQQVGAVFQRMPRLVRELATKTAKKVHLEMVGENTEVDRSIIERLGDPLTHIIRNSIDHGIESPAARVAAGKSEEGTIRLSAEHRGSRIVIEIRDDGAGINSERVLKKARERGLVSPDANLSDDEINNLIFLPGFSTAEKVSDISGRGVGMDVVRRNIQDVGGRISLKSDRGRGMTIQLALPLTLAVMDGMVIRVRQETYVMPMSAIVECLRPPAADIHNLIGTSGHAEVARQSGASRSALRFAGYRFGTGGLRGTGRHDLQMRGKARTSALSSTSCADTSKSSSRASKKATARFRELPAPRSSVMAGSRSFWMLKSCPIWRARKMFRSVLPVFRSQSREPQPPRTEVEAMMPLGDQWPCLRSDNDAKCSSP